VRHRARPEPIAGGYRIVVRDRAFVHLAVTNVAMIAVGWGVFTWLMPPYAKNEIGVSARLTGFRSARTWPSGRSAWTGRSASTTW
jgi:hypothetical protein